MRLAQVRGQAYGDGRSRLLGRSVPAGWNHGRAIPKTAGLILRLQRTHGNQRLRQLLDGMEGRFDEAAISRQILAAKGPGRPLDTTTRERTEDRLDHDLSTVRVHTDDFAAQTAERLRADAFTIGRDIFFATDRYRLNTSQGTRLLAHELAHVVQQSAEAGGAEARLATSRHAAEGEADRISTLSSAAPAVRLRVPQSVQRQEAALLAWQADLAQRQRRVRSLIRDGNASMSLFPDAAGLLQGYQLVQNFVLELAPDARPGDYALVQWIKGELYEERPTGAGAIRRFFGAPATQRAYWPANAAGALYGRSATAPWLFTDWIIDSPDADPRFGSHHGLTIQVPTTRFVDAPGIMLSSGLLPAGLRWKVEARMGVYPWGYRIPTTISGWESTRPEPFQEVRWGWEIIVDPSRTSLTVTVT